MPTPLSRTEAASLKSWDLAQWNQVLFGHFFVSPDEPAQTINRLFITGDELRVASGATDCSSEEIRKLFLACVRKAIGERTLGYDADARASHWQIDSEQIPPFLSHLLLTSMVANDLAEELKSIGDFRKRLTKILEGGVHHGLHLLRPLWERLSEFLSFRNAKDAHIRTLRLPQIPDSGHHSIIGYPLRLSVPTRRDQNLLSELLIKNNLAGLEPPVQEVVNAIQNRSAKFSAPFREMFFEFMEMFKKSQRTTLSQTTFWLAVREISLATSGITGVVDRTLQTRVELEDEDGHFWFYLTCDREAQVDGYECVELPALRKSSFRYALRSRTEHSTNVVDQAFSGKVVSPCIDSFLKLFRSALSDGIAMFAEDEESVFTFTASIPSSGRLSAIVNTRVSEQLSRVPSARDVPVEITNGRYAGWLEWRGLSAESLQEVDFSDLKILSGVRALRRTLPLPQIYLRGGVRSGDGFVSVAGSLPQVEISGADSVMLLRQDGSILKLEPGRSALGRWDFPASVDPASLVGPQRLKAYASANQIAERVINFVADVTETRYKRPLTNGQWFTESGQTDIAFVNKEDSLAPWTQERQEVFSTAQESGQTRPPTDGGHQLNLATVKLAALFGSRRGVSEGELAAIFKEIFSVPWFAVWSVLRAWVENGALDCLVDVRWRARVYFGRRPALVAYKTGSGLTAVLTGLIPPYLRDRFKELVPLFGMQQIERRTLSSAVPPLACCRATSIGQLTSLVDELELPPLNWLCEPDHLAVSIDQVVRSQDPEPLDWPVYKEWDWQRLAFTDNRVPPHSSQLWMRWCRRDDGPDCYKIYRDGSVVWWSRSRTWAILAALTLADISALVPEASAEISSCVYGAYLPLPLARFTAVVSAVSPGPMTEGSKSCLYRYVLPTASIRDLLLRILWPSKHETRLRASSYLRTLLTSCFATSGPSIPMPVTLAESLKQFDDLEKRSLPCQVPLNVLPRLYAEIRASTRGNR